MPKDATINARVDSCLKAKAEKVLAEVGVSTSEVVTMLLHQIVLQRGIPFDVRIPNAASRNFCKIAGVSGEGSRNETKAA